MKYEYMWERDPSLPSVIEEAWNISPACSSLVDLKGKLNNTRDHLKDWSRNNFGSVTKDIKKKRNRIDALWKKPRSPSRDVEVQKISNELDELLHREEIMWRKISRVDWLLEGDRNTKYFHKKATWRQ